MGNEAPVHMQAARGAQLAWRGTGLLEPRVLSKYTVLVSRARDSWAASARARANNRHHDEDAV